MSKENNTERTIISHPFAGYSIEDIIKIDNYLLEIDTTDFSIEDKEFISYIRFVRYFLEGYSNLVPIMDSLKFEYIDVNTFIGRFISEFEKSIIYSLRSHKRPSEEEVLKSMGIEPNEFFIGCVRDIISLYIKNMGLKAVEGSEDELTRAFDNETYNSSKRGFKLDNLASDFRNSFGTGEAFTLGEKGKNQ